MVEHVNVCMTVNSQLTALGETVPDKQFVDKLLNIYWELAYLRPMLALAPVDEIVAGLTDGYSQCFRISRFSRISELPINSSLFYSFKVNSAPLL